MISYQERGKKSCWNTLSRLRIHEYQRQPVPGGSFSDKKKENGAAF